MKNKSCKNKYALPFCDRQKEHAQLEAWARGGPRLAVCHGRRRLGKSRLLRYWQQRTECAYVLATEGTPASQRLSLAEDLSSVIPNFGDVVYPNWRALFRSLVAQWPRSERPYILAIDEFPYLAKSSPELPSVLQAVVDDPGAAHLPLILCGSSQRMMQGLVLDETAPLYGRAQVLLRLQPLPVAEISVLPHVEEPTQMVQAYAAWGGVPRYWELAAGLDATPWECIETLVLSPSGVLHEEAGRVLRDEEAATLERALCQAIGRGARRPSELAGRLGVPATTLAKPLRHLVELGLVRRDAPYDFAKGRPDPASRSSVYLLADPFLAMWYQCVHPYLSGLELNAASARGHAREAWQHHVAAIWEDLVRSHWHCMAIDGLEWEPAGRYWEGRRAKGVEWDAVSITSDRRNVMLGECKWGRSLSSRDLKRFAREIGSRRRPEWIAGRTTSLFLFVPSAKNHPREIEGVRLMDAAGVLGLG